MNFVKHVKSYYKKNKFKEEVTYGIRTIIFEFATYRRTKKKGYRININGYHY